MRALTAAAATLALASASLAAAFAQTTVSDATAAAKKSVATKACTSAADALVWFVPGTKLFFRKGQTGFGKGAGSLVCRHVALGKHGRAAPTPGPSAEPAEPSAMPMTTAAPAAGGGRRPLQGPVGPAPPPAPPPIASPAPAPSATPLAGPWIAAPRPWNKA